MVNFFYNKYEVLFPVIDNLADEKTGIRYALAYGGLKGAASSLSSFLRYLLTHNSWAQFVSFLDGEDDVEVPQWNVAQIKADGGLVGANDQVVEGGATFVANSLSDPDLRKVALDGIPSGEFNVTLAGLSDVAIGDLCNERALRRAKEGANSTTMLCGVLDEQEPQMKYIIKRALQLQDSDLKSYLQQVRNNEWNRGFANGPRIFIYGHTHSAEEPKNFTVDDSWMVKTVNTGAFQRIASAEQFEAIIKARKYTRQEALLKLQPENLPARYSFVSVKYVGKVPTAKLCYWTQDDQGKWDGLKNCTP